MRTILATSIFSMMLIPCVASAQKPVRESVTSVLYKQPPDTLPALYAASDAVIVGRVLSERGVESVQAGRRVLTELTCTIVEIVKPHPQIGPAGSQVSFRVSGGEIDRGDHIERVVDRSQPKLLPGREYLVALIWDPNESAFFPTFGPGAIFETTDGSVVPLKQTALAVGIKGFTSRQLIAGLTKAASAK